MSYETGRSMDVKVVTLFYPDPILPAQYLETFRRKSSLEPRKEAHAGRWDYVLSEVCLVAEQ